MAAHTTSIERPFTGRDECRIKSDGPRDASFTSGGRARLGGLIFREIRWQVQTADGRLSSKLVRP
jgi:hypothetical protein